MCIKTNQVGKQEVGIWRVKKRFTQNGVPIWNLWRNIRFLPSIIAEKNATKNEHIWVPKTLPTIWHTYMKLVTKYQIPVINICWEKCNEKFAYMLNVYKSQLRRQTGSRNLTGQKTLPTKWGTYMKHVTKYQISAINICWEKCDEKWAYMFNVYKNQQSRQTGSRNLTGPKTLPTIWHTYMKLVTKYQISAIDSYWKKCDKKYLGLTDRGKSVYLPPPPGSGGIMRRNLTKNRSPHVFWRTYINFTAVHV